MMARKRRSSRQPAAARRSLPRPALLLGAVIVVAAVAIVVALALNRTDRPAGQPVAWATLGTRDVHALAFDPAGPDRLFFGHHGGLLESIDGGRSWRPTALHGIDAMNVSAPANGFFQVAGHDVYMETTDGGRTWRNVPNDLPGLDLHAFAVDPTDPARAWAYAVGFGLFGTADRGRTWQLLQPGPWAALAAFSTEQGTVLLALDGAGLVRSDDGGRTWIRLTSPPGQAFSLAAAPAGSIIYAGTNSGLARSIDSGRTWAETSLRTPVITVAVHPADPKVVAAVDDRTRFFRSADGGASWPGP